MSRDTDLVQSPLEPLDDAGGGGAGLAGVPLSVCGRQVCIVDSVYNQQLRTTFHLGGAARHSLKSCDQSQLQDLKKQVIYRVY